MLTKPVNFEQTDPRWKNKMYSAIGDKAQTIGNSGCGPTCAAMVVATLRDKAITPIDACAWAVVNGFRTLNNGTFFGFFVSYFAQYGIECKQTDSVAEAIKAIEAGHMVIGRALKGLWTSSGHYILAYEIDGSMILINDPNDPGIGSSKSGRERAPLSTFRAQVGPFWIVKEEWRNDDMAKVIEQIAKEAKMTVEETLSALAVLVKFANRTEEAWEKDGAKKLIERKLISTPRDGREMVEFGELGVILDNLIVQYVPKK